MQTQGLKDKDKHTIFVFFFFLREGKTDRLIYISHTSLKLAIDFPFVILLLLSHKG